jgi:hypothetical protein
MALLGARRISSESSVRATSLAAAEASVDRENVEVTAR